MSLNDVQNVFSSFSVDDQRKSEWFYSDMLGLTVKKEPMGLTLQAGNQTVAFVYQKDNHQPATYTILNFVVDSLDTALLQLKEKGVDPEKYEGLTDADGIHRGSRDGNDPDIAWFKDPAGNVFSLIQNDFL